MKKSGPGSLKDFVLLIAAAICLIIVGLGLVLIALPFLNSDDLAIHQITFWAVEGVFSVGAVWFCWRFNKRRKRRLPSAKFEQPSSPKRPRQPHSG
jgi:hypothetical protein